MKMMVWGNDDEDGDGSDEDDGDVDDHDNDAADAYMNDDGDLLLLMVIKMMTDYYKDSFDYEEDDNVDNCDDDGNNDDEDDVYGYSGDDDDIDFHGDSDDDGNGEREGGMNIWSTLDFQGSETILYDTVRANNTMHFSKSIEFATRE